MMLRAAKPTLQPAVNITLTWRQPLSLAVGGEEITMPDGAPTRRAVGAQPPAAAPQAPPGLARLNALPAGDAVKLLLGCCRAPGWARQVADGRPYASLEDLLAAADAAWAARGPGDLEAAMAGHPRIGERGRSAQSRREQSAVGSDAGTLQALREANAAYEARFGHVFLICATGRGPGDILAELRRRMANDPATELGVAGAEIGKINALRLRKLAAA
jgi:2-oxo-4-hydroxy-4-carboxy-5-ureidoimidazoline decarboxylase